MMNWIIYLFGSGTVFFLGLSLLPASLTMFVLARRKWPRIGATLLSVLGLILIAASATPLPYWFYTVFGVASLAWLAAERVCWAWLQARRTWLRGSVVLLWIAALVIELPYHFQAAVPNVDEPKLTIIADSITAGRDSRDKKTWPRILGRTHSIEVNDLSQMGATAASALKQADRLPARRGIVLLEIGGNDLLGTTPAAEFDRDLDRLLTRVTHPGRVMLMFELPLPPFRNEYGRIQRRLAAKHGVILIPKRVLMGLLSEDGATLDSIHLSPEGHRRMAETGRRLLEPAVAR